MNPVSVDRSVSGIATATGCVQIGVFDQLSAITRGRKFAAGRQNIFFTCVQVAFTFLTCCSESLIWETWTDCVSERIAEMNEEQRTIEPLLRGHVDHVDSDTFISVAGHFVPGEKSIVQSHVVVDRLPGHLETKAAQAQTQREDPETHGPVWNEI